LARRIIPKPKVRPLSWFGSKPWQDNTTMAQSLKNRILFENKFLPSDLDGKFEATLDHDNQ
jgi:hypothetical protein